MAALTLYATNSLAGVYQALSETDPGAEAYATPATGWIVSTGSTNRSEFRPQVERAASTFTATTFPDGSLDTTNGDGFRSATTYTGVVDAGTWTFYFAARAQTSATGQDGRVHYRVFRSANADGSSATELTSGIVDGSSTTDLAASATQVSSATFSPGSVTLTAEYLFVQVAWGRTGAASMSSADVNMRIGGANSTRLVTPNFTPAYSLSVNGMTISTSSENVTVTPHDILADLEITLAAPSGYAAHRVANIDEIANWRCAYFGLDVEVGDCILYATAGGGSLDADGIVSGASTLSFYWRDADNNGGTWSSIQTWESDELLVNDMRILVTQDSVFFPGNTVASSSVTLSPPSGYSVHAVTDISQATDTGCIYYPQSPAVAVGDKIIYENVTAGNAWTVTIDSQGFVIIDSGGSGEPDEFDYAVRDADSASDLWGTWGTFAMVGELAVADSTVSVTMSAPTLTQHNVLTTQGMTISVGMSEPVLLAGGALSVNGMTLGLSMGNVTLNAPEENEQFRSLAIDTIEEMAGESINSMCGG